MRWPRRPRQTGYRGALVQQPDPLPDLEPVTEPMPMRTYPSVGSRYQAAPVAPQPGTHQAAGRGWQMTVNTDVPAPHMNPRVRAALTSLQLDAADYAARGMLYRIDDAEQARQRGEEPDGRSVIAQTVAKAARHLMGPRVAWDPSGWDHALTATPPPSGQMVDVPWPDDPDDVHGWLAAYERELGRPA